MNVQFLEMSSWYDGWLIPASLGIAFTVANKSSGKFVENAKISAKLDEYPICKVEIGIFSWLQR